MGFRSFLRSDNSEKLMKLRKWWHKNDWNKAHSPGLIPRVHTEWLFLRNKNDCIVVDGWLLKFYVSKEKYMNWGDDLNVYLLELLTNKRIVPCEMLLFRKMHKKYTVIGSIIPGFVNERTVVWGSGCMNFDQKIKHHPLRVLAVRGPKTRKFLLDNGVDCPEVYGDPALLLPKLYKPKVEKKYGVTFVPHHRDFDIEPEIVERLKKEYPRSHVINMTNYGKWTDVIDEICESEVVVTSSLHGMVVSDAYGIPNAFCEFKYHHPKYDKYEDYCESVKKTFAFPVDQSAIDDEFLVGIKKSYTKPNIDVTKLLEVCPFKIQIDLK